jgi:hypothetical protein
MDRVRRVIDTLASPTMAGRGASGEGDKIAASFIADQMAEIGLLTHQDSYFQYFYYNINTFPSEPKLRVGQKNLRAGYDFIPDAGLPVVHRKWKQHFLDSSTAADSVRLRQFLKKASPNKALVFHEDYRKKLLLKNPGNLQQLDRYGAQIILRKQKLTLGLSDRQEFQPVFDVLASEWKDTKSAIRADANPSLMMQYQSANLAGYFRGTEVPDSIILLSAHYDHLGRMGDSIYFPGANDNASGLSMMLELARYFKENPPRYSIWFIAFGAEEAGLIGSKYFTEHPLFPLSSVRFMINLDLMSAGEEGMMAVNGTIFTKEFSLLENLNKEMNALSSIRKRGKAANSDHYYFTEKGVPAFFFYTLGGGTAYHDVHDKASALTLSRYPEVYKLLLAFIRRLQGS